MSLSKEAAAIEIFKRELAASLEATAVANRTDMTLLCALDHAMNQLPSGMRTRVAFFLASKFAADAE